MNEPGRLLDESDNATEKALLRAGRSYRSGQETRAKTLAALGLTGAAAVLAAGTSMAGPLRFAKLSGAKLLVAVSLGAVSLAPVAYHALHKGRRAVSVPAARAESVGRPSPDEAPAFEAASAPAPVAASKVVSPASSRPAARAGVTVSLGQELAALDAARSALARGDGQGALLLLDGYAQTCPQGRLRLEAEMLRIDALAKSGQPQAARRHAELFLRRHPGSVLAGRARSYTRTSAGQGD